MNIKNITYLLALFLLCSTNSFADANYSLRDNNHPWFPLTRATWQMESIQYPHRAKQTTLTNGFNVKEVKLSIRRGHISLGLGCNGHGGKLFLLTENKLSAEPMFSTNMGCNRQLKEADSEISKLLSEVSHFSSNKSTSQPILALQSKNGTRLYFHGEAIPEVKYGEPKARRIVLKQRKKGNCAKQGCREWQEVFVDKEGAITHKSEWRYGSPKIHGFKAKPNNWYSMIINEFNTPDGTVWYVKYRGSGGNLAYSEGRAE